MADIIPAVPVVVSPVVPPVVEGAVVVPVVPEVVVPVIPAAEPLPKPAPSGNAFFDSMQDALHEKGMSSDKFVQDLLNGGVITADNRATLVTAFGEAQTKIMEQGLAKEMESINTTKSAEAQKVFDAIQLPGQPDGKEAFKAIAAWAKTGIPEADRATYNEMLAAGGVQAQLAIQNLKEKYMADPAFVAPAALIPGTAVPIAAGLAPISRATYVAERRTAHNNRDAVKVAELDARAQASMKTPTWRPSY